MQSGWFKPSWTASPGVIPDHFIHPAISNNTQTIIFYSTSKEQLLILAKPKKWNRISGRKNEYSIFKSERGLIRIPSSCILLFLWTVNQAKDEDLRVWASSETAAAAPRQLLGGERGVLPSSSPPSCAPRRSLDHPCLNLTSNHDLVSYLS